MARGAAARGEEDGAVAAAAEGAPEDLPEEGLVVEAGAGGGAAEAAVFGEIAVGVDVDDVDTAALVEAHVDAAVVAQAEDLEGAAAGGGDAAQLERAEDGGDRGRGDAVDGVGVPLGVEGEDVRVTVGEIVEEDLSGREHARHRPAEEGDGELAAVDVALHDGGLIEGLDHEGDLIAQGSRVMHDGLLADAHRAVFALGLDDGREGDAWEVIGAVDAHSGGDAHAGAREDLVALELVEAVAQRVERAAGEGEAEALEQPGGVDLEAAVAAQGLAEVEDHRGAVIADGGEHLARAEDRAVRDADARGVGDGLEDALGDGAHAVGAVGATRAVTGARFEWWFVGALLLVAVRQEQDSRFCAHGLGDSSAGLSGMCKGEGALFLPSIAREARRRARHGAMISAEIQRALAVVAEGGGGDAGALEEGDEEVGDGLVLGVDEVPAGLERAA